MEQGAWSREKGDELGNEMKEGVLNKDTLVFSDKHQELVVCILLACNRWICVHFRF